MSDGLMVPIPQEKMHQAPVVLPQTDKYGCKKPSYPSIDNHTNCMDCLDRGRELHFFLQNK